MPNSMGQFTSEDIDKKGNYALRDMVNPPKPGSVITNSQGSFTTPDPENNQFDRYIVPQEIKGSGGYPVENAQSRFTRAPIMFKSIPSEIGSVAVGSTDIKTPSSRITAIIGGKPSYKDLMQLLAHESIHSLLHNTGNDSVLVDQEKQESSDIPPDKYLSSYPHLSAQFVKSDRGGIPSLELPAYMGSFKSGEIPDVTQEQADSYMKDLMNKLPAPVSLTLKRIMESIR